MANTRIFIPEAIRVKQIRKAISDEYTVIYYDPDKDNKRIANNIINKYKEELKQIFDKVTKKYLTITPDDAKFYISIEQYVKDKYDIDNLFTCLGSKFKKPIDLGWGYSSTNYVKLMDELHIEIMYSTIPNTRNVVRKSDIDKLLYNDRVLNEYYDN